jgi:hypothetical protein
MRISHHSLTSEVTANGLHGPDSLRIRQAGFEDYGPIAAVQARNGLAVRSYEDWLALWSANPIYKQRSGDWPIGWVLETGSGEIVGSISNIPLAYQFRGRELLAVTSCSWAVDPKYRSYSMQIMSCLMRQKDIDLFICTTVSPASESCYRDGFQFSKPPAGSWNNAAFWITHYRGFAECALKSKSVPLSGVFSHPVSAALWCWDRVRNVAVRVPKTNSEIEMGSGFDARFDEFWEELKYQKRNSLLAVRTREALAWHFRYSLKSGTLRILTVSRGGRLIAYAIFDRPDNAALGFKRVRLVDFQALEGSGKELARVLHWMLRKCREEGIHVLETSGCWLDQPGWTRIPAPYRRTLRSWTYYYRAADKNLSEALADTAVWAPSSFDGDASL